MRWMPPLVGLLALGMTSIKALMLSPNCSALEALNEKRFA